MSGRYPYWHLRRGANQAPAALRDLGRKLLAHLQERQRLGAPPTLQIQQTIAEGTVVARFIAGVPQVIYLPVSGAQGGRVSNLPHGFVVTARSIAYPSGIDVAHPQQILAPAEGSANTTTYFYDTDVSLYGSFPRDKGVYHRAFPDGLTRGGNIDWRGTDGVRLNWYGPTRRYWYDCYRKPDGQYARWVFLNGHALLDLDAYATDSGIAPFAERYVLGAALKDTWLYVMLGRINDFEPFSDSHWPPGSVHAWISPPYPEGTTDLRLVRFNIARTAGVEGPTAFHVVANSHETLWTHTGRGWVNPWFFAPDASRCESFAMPDELRKIWHYDEATKVTTEHATPSTSNEHGLVVIDTEAGTATATITTQPGVNLYVPPYDVEIAVDYDANGVRVPVRIRALSEENPLEIVVGTGAGIDLFRSLLLTLDARKAAVVLARYGYVGSNHTVHLFLDGVEEAMFDSTYSGDSSYSIWNRWSPAGLTYTHAFPHLTVAPLYAAAGVSVSSQTGTSTNAKRSYFDFTPLQPSYVTLPNSELHGRFALYRWAWEIDDRVLVPPTDPAGVMKSPTKLPFAEAQNADGMRTPRSLAIDDEGRFALSSTFHFRKQTTEGGSFFTVYIGCAHATSLAGTLEDLTGVSAGSDAQTGKPLLDARFSPIWVIGALPPIAGS